MAERSTAAQECQRTGHWTDAGRCGRCDAIVGSTVASDPYDYSSARRELESIHAFLKSQGMEQSEGDGQWGYVSSTQAGIEWNELGTTTVEAIEHLIHQEGYGGWCSAQGDNDRLGKERDWYRDAHELGKEILDDLRLPSKDIVLPDETRELIEDWRTATFFPPGTHPSESTASVERAVSGSLAGRGQEHPDTALSNREDGR